MVKKKRNAKPEKIPRSIFKGEKAKAVNARLQLEAFDGFFESGEKVHGCVLL